MSKRRVTYLLIFIISFSQLFASEHGIYTKVFSNVKSGIDDAGSKIVEALKSSGYEILAFRDIETPAIVREENNCNFKAKQILFTSNELKSKLCWISNKYLLGSFLRVSLYEDENGLQVNIANPETIGRIVLNDLWETGEEEKYNSAVKWLSDFTDKLISQIHSTNLGKKVITELPPIRSDEDLRESSKDMFMMVGPMTFFNDEDQFPVIYETPAQDGKNGLKSLLSKFETNLKKFKPTKDDIEYRLTKNADVLKWKIVGKIFSPDSTAMLIGITRPRTEGLSFHIAGAARENEKNMCPGIDHAAAYPIEVLAVYENNKIKVYTAREMFRMDMYFWDAGMQAFMNHMSMPSLLDDSIKRALLNK